MYAARRDMKTLIIFYRVQIENFKTFETKPQRQYRTLFHRFCVNVLEILLACSFYTRCYSFHILFYTNISIRVSRNSLNKKILFDEMQSYFSFSNFWMWDFEMWVFLLIHANVKLISNLTMKILWYIHWKNSIYSRYRLLYSRFLIMNKSFQCISLYWNWSMHFCVLS